MLFVCKLKTIEYAIEFSLLFMHCLLFYFNSMTSLVLTLDLILDLKLSDFLLYNITFCPFGPPRFFKIRLPQTFKISSCSFNILHKVFLLLLLIIASKLLVVFNTPSFYHVIMALLVVFINCMRGFLLKKFFSYYHRHILAFMNNAVQQTYITISNYRKCF